MVERMKLKQVELKQKGGVYILKQMESNYSKELEKNETKGIRDQYTKRNL